MRPSGFQKKVASSIRWALFLSAALSLSGCITMAVIVETEQNALRATVDGVRVKMIADAHQSTSCTSIYQEIGVKVQTRRAGKTNFFCMITRFSPKVKDPLQRARLARLALNKFPKLSIQPVTDAQMAKATVLYQSRLGAGVLRPSQLLLPVVRN